MQLSTYIIRFRMLLFLMLFSTAKVQGGTWRLDQALEFPAWLKLSVEHRTRYETLDEQYRATVNGQTGSGGDQALVFRTLVHPRIDFNAFVIGAELEDSRIALADSGSASSSNRLTTTIANPLELLQAYLEIPADNLLIDGSHGRIRAGRITMDVGSRRFVARNRYRNTINAFNGLDWQWRAGERDFRAFYTLPVIRRVAGDILDNHAEFDVEDPHIRFWGLYYSQAVVDKATRGEAFLFGLNEKDAENIATLDRDLYTFGFRLWRKPAVQKFDAQLESVYQLGESRASTRSTKTLDHWAHFQHGEMGYSFSGPWSPRLIAQFDYASGDDDPDDGQNNRFDTLYGARRFDFGPTSLYGAFARSNLLSPALRLQVKPAHNVQLMIAGRGFWRASTADSWTTAGIKGDSAQIGTQLEVRLRWEPLPGNLQFEGGIAHLFAGDLMDEVGKNDVTYAYSQMAVKF